MNGHDGLVDAATRIIDYRVSKKRAAATTEALVNRFQAYYTRKASVPEYVEFDTRGDRGIPRLVRYFDTFDPVNAVGDFDAWSDYTGPTDLELKHAYGYMKAPEFNRELLRTTEFDSVIHAVFSYLLHWTNEGLTDYGERYPEFKQLTLSVVTEKDRTPVYVTKDGVPFVRSAFRMLAHHFNNSGGAARTAVVRPVFSINDYVSPELVAHFREVYRRLLDESMTKREIDLLETSMRSPLSTIADAYNGAYRRLNNPVNVITGQACCGKTTLLNRLKSYGWNVCSRGDLGTFSGKAKCAPTIASLHAAMENALRRGDVLGDRGPIDNPLWSVIMPLCDLRYKDRVVDELLRFFDGTMNEHVVAYYACQQRVFVFVDPYPGLNRERMLKRCTGGDAFRARIYMYPIAQCIAYYIAARLFGWTVRCVPYDERREFQPQRYAAIADEINRSFGRPTKQPPLSQASRPSGHLLEDTEYSIATGIFK